MIAVLKKRVRNKTLVTISPPPPVIETKTASSYVADTGSNDFVHTLRESQSSPIPTAAAAAVAVVARSGNRGGKRGGDLPPPRMMVTGAYEEVMKTTCGNQQLQFINGATMSSSAIAATAAVTMGGALTITGDTDNTNTAITSGVVTRKKRGRKRKNYNDKAATKVIESENHYCRNDMPPPPVATSSISSVPTNTIVAESTLSIMENTESLSSAVSRKNPAHRRQYRYIFFLSIYYHYILSIDHIYIFVFFLYFRRKLGHATGVQYCFSPRTLGQLLMDLHHETKRKCTYYTSPVILRQMPFTIPIVDRNINITNCHKVITTTPIAMKMGIELPQKLYEQKLTTIQRRLVAALSIKRLLNIQYLVYEQVNPTGIHSMSNFFAGHMKITDSLIEKLKSVTTLAASIELIKTHAVFVPSNGEHTNLPILYESQIMTDSVRASLKKLKDIRYKCSPQRLYRASSDFFGEYSKICYNLYRSVTDCFVVGLLNQRVIIIEDIKMDEIFTNDTDATTIDAKCFGMLDRETTDYALFKCIKSKDRPENPETTKSNHAKTKHVEDSSVDENLEDNENEDEPVRKKKRKVINYSHQAMLAMPRVWSEGELFDTLQLQPDCDAGELPAQCSTFQLTVGPLVNGFIQDRTVSRKIHIIHDGAPVMWLFLSTRSRIILEKVLRSHVEHRRIRTFATDPNMSGGYVFSLDFFRKNNIDFDVIIQWPGECLIINEGTCAQSIVLGANYCESVEIQCARGKFTNHLIPVRQTLLSSPSMANGLTLPLSNQQKNIVDCNATTYRLAEVNHTDKCQCCGTIFQDPHEMIAHKRLMTNTFKCLRCKKYFCFFEFTSHIFSHVVDYSACYICQRIYEKNFKHLIDVHAIPLKRSVSRDLSFQSAYNELLKSGPILPGKLSPSELHRRRQRISTYIYIFFSIVLLNWLLFFFVFFFTVDIVNETSLLLGMTPISSDEWDQPDDLNEKLSSAAVSIDVDDIPESLKHYIDDTISPIIVATNTKTRATNSTKDSSVAAVKFVPQPHHTPTTAVIPTTTAAPPGPIEKNTSDTLYDWYFPQKRDKYLNLILRCANEANLTIKVDVIIAYFYYHTGVTPPQGSAPKANEFPIALLKVSEKVTNKNIDNVKQVSEVLNTPINISLENDVSNIVGKPRIRKPVTKWTTIKCSTCNKKIIESDMADHEKICAQASICDICGKTLSSIYCMKRHRVSCAKKNT
ncbi:FVU3 protein [Dolichomitus sp. PSUC_FEM 10030005]|nr:FVU3 protein [Dolichomitus sp. PSUC_FEM 10030005]